MAEVYQFKTGDGVALPEATDAVGIPKPHWVELVTDTATGNGLTVIEDEVTDAEEHPEVGLVAIQVYAPVEAGVSDTVDPVTFPGVQVYVRSVLTGTTVMVLPETYTA